MLCFVHNNKLQQQHYAVYVALNISLSLIYPRNHFDEDFPDDSVWAASNYCRDPNGWGRTGCYYHTPSTGSYLWEDCDITDCPGEERAGKWQEIASKLKTTPLDHRETPPGLNILMLVM